MIPTQACLPSTSRCAAIRIVPHRCSAVYSAADSGYSVVYFAADGGYADEDWFRAEVSLSSMFGCSSEKQKEDFQ